MPILSIISIAQIAISFLLVATILLQQRGAGLSESFGGVGGSYHTKRGIERILFISTIVLSCLFAILTFIALLVK